VDARVNRIEPDALAGLLANAFAANRSLGVLLVSFENVDRLVAALGPRAVNGAITELARRLRHAVKPADTIVRVGDAKFAVIVAPVRTQGVLVLAASKIGQILAAPVPVAETEVCLVARIGIALSPGYGADSDELLRHAESALLVATTANLPYTVYAPAEGARAIDSLGLERELDLALKKDELELYYQPKIATADFRPCGAEALLRWTNPHRGPISPEIFIPLAERIDQIGSLTAFVLNTAVRQSAEWPQHFGPLNVAVNVTPSVLESGDLYAMVASALGLWDGVPDRLCVEITEGAIIRNPEASFNVLRELRDLGVRISIDDFGTGHSSLAYFKNIPADELKIDKSFVLKMLKDDGDRKIVCAVIELAKSFGLKVTAEGVEDGATAAVLAQLQCDRLQGYFYSRPLPQKEFIAWLERYPRTEPRVSKA
jgi:diguanylate cyclase (GGDEF)-like protein